MPWAGKEGARPLVAEVAARAELQRWDGMVLHAADTALLAQKDRAGTHMVTEDREKVRHDKEIQLI